MAYIQNVLSNILGGKPSFWNKGKLTTLYNNFQIYSFSEIFVGMVGPLIFILYKNKYQLWIAHSENPSDTKNSKI